jgi:hypothetical protein
MFCFGRDRFTVAFCAVEETRAESNNAIFGLPLAPKSCHAIGRDGSAAVWWIER